MKAVFDQMLSRYELKTSHDRINAIHEVMQQITLAALYRAGFFSKAAFYGGTCLRIFHGLQRFSEDLDFSLIEKNESFQIENYFDPIIDEFLSYGRKVEILKKIKKQDSKVESAFLKDTTDIVNIAFQTEPSVKIKIEVDTDPPLKFKTENKLLLLPFSFMTRCFNLPGLFAGKVHAFLFRSWKNRVKGRDWYDLEWHIRKGNKVHFTHLKERSLQSGYSGKKNFTPSIMKELMREKILSTSIEQVKSDLKPFIKEPEKLDIWDRKYFLQLVELIEFE